VFDHLLQRGFRRRRLAPARNLGGDIVSSASLSIVNPSCPAIVVRPPFALPGGRATLNHPSRRWAPSPLPPGRAPALTAGGRAGRHLFTEKAQEVGSVLAGQSCCQAFCGRGLRHPSFGDARAYGPRLRGL
jgi:hypothetical protein